MSQYQIYGLMSDWEERAQRAINEQQEMEETDLWLKSLEAREEEENYYFKQLVPGLQVLVNNNIITLDEAYEIQEENFNGNS